MSQKFISLEDAAARLGITKERLNHLRESNVINGYKDGASWKFRTEHVERLESEGVPSEDDDNGTLDAGRAYSLGDFEDDLPELGAADLGAGDLDLDDLGEATDLTLNVAGESGIGVGEGTARASSDPTGIGMDDLDDDDIGLGIEPLGDGDDAESILLTGDDEIEGGLPRPQSTIIGKSELSLESDLQLVAGSDAPKAAAPSASSFDNLEELELDLEAQSSRLIDPKQAAAARAAADSGSLALAGDEMDLDLASASGSDVLGKQDPDLKGTPGLSGPGSIAGLSGLDSIQLGEDEDDDMVLGGSDDSGGLASGDSGINLSPSDSGFALDEVPLDLGGSAIGSALDLAALSAAGSGISGLGGPSALGAGDFQLTPADPNEEDEDSSQIVALEEVGEEDEDLPGFEAVDDDDDLGGGFGSEAAAAPMLVGAGPEATFPGWVVGMLGAGFMSMLLCGVMALDLVKSMWAWDEPFSLNSSLMDGIKGILGW